MSQALLVALPLAAAATASAQDLLRIRAPRRDTITATSTVTAAFMVSSLRDDTVEVRTRLEMPGEWSVLTGGSTFTVAPKALEMLMLSVLVPARTAAGVYPVRVWITTASDPNGVMDSVHVRVPERRSVDVTLLDRPGYVVSGKGYDAGFLVRNRGNVATTFRLTIRSILGKASLADSLLLLGPDESRLVRARVRTPTGVQAAADDVVEMAVFQPNDSERTLASARVTVVPEPSRTIEEYLKVPVRVNLRAATSQGVSPFEVFGQGFVRDGGSTQLDFLVRGRTGPYAAFGERDEYRVDLRAPSWRARAGDQLFMLSSLTGAGRPGFGVGAEGERGIFGAGAYSQQFRREVEKGTESGMFVTARPIDDARLALNVVQRAGGNIDGRIASAAASILRGHFGADVELARSQNGGSSGLGRTARLNGNLPSFTFDLGHMSADTAFSGSQRGAEHTYFTSNTPGFGFLSFGFNGSMHRTDLSRSTGVPYDERFNTASFSTTAFDRYTVELGAVSRGTTIQSVVQNGEQRGVRARADHDIPFVTLTVELEAGRARETALTPRTFTEASIGVRKLLARGQLGAYAQHYSGGAITKGADGAVTFGGDASLRMRSANQLMLMAYATRQRMPGAEWHTQLDAIAARALRNGNSVTLRARLMGGGSLMASEQSVMYLEYGMPFRLPVSRLRTTGRVFGRVVDAVTGNGVPGALVRLGPQVAITDKEGQVAFGGVPGGEHRLSMSQETSFANAVFVGDPTLQVDSTRVRPTTFSLAIARSARIDVDVRRFTAARTAIAGSADSLTEAGVVSNATLILSGERDTLYRTTGEDGKATFTDIPPGKWTLAIRGDTPAFTRFDPDRVDITLDPGQVTALSFRLVPRRREIQIIGDGQELRPTAADPKSQNTGLGGTKTVKPDERKQDHK